MIGWSGISARRWHMPRKPFAWHVGALVVCVAGFALTNAALPWAAAILLTLLLPISQSMRLNQLGRSRFWPLLPLTGALILLFQLFSALASIGGAPSTTLTTGDRLATMAGLAGLGIMAVITLICLLPEHWVAHPSQEVLI